MTARPGTLRGLTISRGRGEDPAAYELTFVQGVSEPLNGRIGCGVSMEWTGVTFCINCETQGRRSFGGGYCYDCFRTLARCDLCVVSPDRCHFHEGTCREPEWGTSFCMQPHRVYLANSSGLKVGLTRCGREIGRWLDQGAIQGLPILEAATRRAAGLAEVQIAKLMPDRTDWRKMLRSDVPEIDLQAAARSLEEQGLVLPEGASWSVADEVVRLHYPLTASEIVPRRLKLAAGRPLSGNLLGMKGQYLVLHSGVLNIRHYAGHQVRMTFGDPYERTADAGEQLGLF